VRVRVKDNRGEVMERTLPYENRFGADPMAELEELVGMAELAEMFTQDGTVDDVIHAVVPR